MEVNMSKIECVSTYANKLSDKEIEDIYGLLYYNMSKLYDSPLKESYKKEWIETNSNADNILFLLFYNKDHFVGFIQCQVSDIENHIQEVQVAEEVQGDGSTFRAMIKSFVASGEINRNVPISGEIWVRNRKSRSVFMHMGAKNRDGRYSITYEDLCSWISNE